jgi:hypothetical protein
MITAICHRLFNSCRLKGSAWMHKKSLACSYKVTSINGKIGPRHEIVRPTLMLTLTIGPSKEKVASFEY